MMNLKGIVKRVELFGRMPLCNCKPDTAPHFGHFCFPLCYRCLFISIGIILSHFLGRFICKELLVVKLVICVLLIVPCYIDGYLSYSRKSMYRSNNAKRIILGFFAGVGIYFLCFNLFPWFY